MLSVSRTILILLRAYSRDSSAICNVYCSPSERQFCWPNDGVAKEHKPPSALCSSENTFFSLVSVHLMDDQPAAGPSLENCTESVRDLSGFRPKYSKDVWKPLSVMFVEYGWTSLETVSSSRTLSVEMEKLRYDP